MKLTYKIISIFFICVLSALTVMAVIGINFSIRQSTQSLKEAADIALTSLSTTLSEDLGTAFAQIKEIAGHGAVTARLTTTETPPRRQRALERDVQRLLSHYTQFNKHYLYVYLGTRDGALIVDRNLVIPEGYTPTTRPWYITALRHPGRAVINDTYISIPDGYPMASISRAVLSGAGEILGVVGIDFLFSRYQAIMQSLAFQSGFIVITHNNASLIAHSRKPSAGFTRLASPENADLLRANSATSGEIVTIDGAPYTAYVKEIPRYKLKILTFVSQATVEKIRRSYILLYGLTAAVILLIVSITGARLARNTLRVEQASIRVKHDFFKNMNHEIRTPLNAVIGFIDLLSETPLNESQKKHLAHTKAAAKHLSEIVNDVLDLSSMRAGKYRIVAQDYLFHDLIGHVAALVEQPLKNKPVRLHVSCTSDIPHALKGDSMRLKQVLLNLLYNAVKFTDSGLIALRIGCRAKGEALCLEFTVTDTGTGIAAEHLPHIFDEFTQFADHEVQGTGLGLALTRQLVERMGGRIACTSSPGKGTRFRFHVIQQPACPPPSPARDAAPHPSRPDTEAASFTAPNASVLLVEDDPLSRIMVTELLKGHRIKVHTAETGPTFLEAMTTGRTFDLVITDMKLPGMSGREVMRRLKATHPPIPLPPVIAFSAVDAMAQIKQGPFDACIRKPIDIPTFRKVLLTWLPDDKVVKKGPGRTPSPPALNASEYEQKYGRDLYLTLLKAFREGHGDGIRIMEGMIDEGRFADLEVRVHRFKGALMNIGAHGPAAMAAVLEDRLEAGEPICLEALRPLRQATAKVMGEVESQIRKML